MVPSGGPAPRPRRAVVVLLGVLGALAGCGPARDAAPHQALPPRTASPARAPLPAISSRLLRWTLFEPLSRAVTLPGPRAGQLTVLGGLTTGDASVAGIAVLDVATGARYYTGALTGPLHDAVGAVLEGRDLVLGGGAYASVATVQAVPITLARATTIGSLPQPRSDAAAAVIGRTAYIVGGYDGTTLDGAVLATTDGTRFSTVASLPVPVRYPAAAALGGRLYVFGGQTSSGAATPVIQVIDPATHTAAVIGQLPEAVTGASALVVSGVLYVLGGSTAAGGGIPPNPSIWAFDSATATLRLAGHLPLPVAHAGALAVDGRGWIVGGESETGPVAAVQELIPRAGARTAATGQRSSGAPQ